MEKRNKHNACIFDEMKWSHVTWNSTSDGNR